MSIHQTSGRFVSRLTRETLAIILAGADRGYTNSPTGVLNRRYILVASFVSLISPYPIVLIPVSGASAY